MVKVEIGIKELLGLYNIDSITKEELKEHLENFTKDNLIESIVEANTISAEEENAEEGDEDGPTD